MEIILYIHFYPHGRSQRHFLNKVHWGVFFATSNEVIWSKSNFLHKTAILAIFRSIDKNSKSFLLINCGLKTLSVEMACDLGIQNEI